MSWLGNPDWTLAALFRSLDPWVGAAVAAGVLAFCTAFVAINVGLRLLPEGRRFLSNARADRRWVVDPSRAEAPRVRLLFWGSVGLAIGVGLSVWPIFRDRLSEPLWPSTHPVAALGWLAC